MNIHVNATTEIPEGIDPEEARKLRNKIHNAYYWAAEEAAKRCGPHATKAIIEHAVKQAVEHVARVEVPRIVEAAGYRVKQDAVERAWLSGDSVTAYEYERDPQTMEVVRAAEIRSCGTRIETEYVRDPATQEIVRTERKEVTTFQRDPKTNELSGKTQTFPSGTCIETEYVRDPKTQEIVRAVRKVTRQ